MTAPFYVLLTNDDGFGAVGLRWVQRALLDAGVKVLMIAPELNHTAGSHRVSLSRKLRMRRRGADSFSLDGTPADCVRVGVLSDMWPTPDVVVAGINHGANAGEDVRYSGTVSAAAEGAALGIPSIALSQGGQSCGIPFLDSSEPSSFPNASLIVALIVRIAFTGLPPWTLINLNCPAGFRIGSGLQWCSVGRREWAGAHTSVVADSPQSYCVDPWPIPPQEILSSGSDYLALSRGAASLNLLAVNGGLHDAFATHASWIHHYGAQLIKDVEGATDRE